MKIRILPVTILTCALILGGKTFHMVEMSQAETAEKATEDKPAAKDNKIDVVEDNKTSTKAKAEPDKAEDEKSDKKEEAKDEHKKDEKEEGKEKKEEIPANVSYERPQENIPQFTDSEKQILQKLADRRAELDNYAKDLDMRAALIDASSKKVDAKLEELKKLKADTEAILVTYNEHEEVKIKSLVKIYENMKPSAAAGIFEQMEMDTLLEIIDKMSEKKASLVLAVMNPAKAKDVTQKLSEQKTIKAKQAADAKASAAAAKPVATPANPPVANATPATPPTSITPPPSEKLETPPPAQSKAAQVDNAKDEAKAEKAPAETEKAAETSDKKAEKDAPHEEAKH